MGKLLELFNGWFDRTADGYRAMIGWALDNRKTVLGLAVAAFAGGIMAFGSLQSAFFPDIDSGEFIVTFKTAPDASITESRGRLEALLASIRDIPAVGHTYATIGAGDSGTVRSGRIYVKLKERSARTLSQKEVQQEFRRRFIRLPGIITSIEEVDETGSSRKPLQVNLRGMELARLKAYAAELRDRMYAIPGIRDIEISLEHDVPEYRLTRGPGEGGERRGDDRSDRQDGRRTGGRRGGFHLRGRGRRRGGHPCPPPRAAPGEPGPGPEPASRGGEPGRACHPDAACRT